MRKKLLIISMVLLGAVLLSACAGGAVRGTTWPGLAADENTAYLADLTFVYAVNLKDGKEVWRFSDKEDGKAQFYATPVITSDGLVVVGSAASKHILYALNPNDLLDNGNFKNPAVEWTFTGAQGSWVAAPLIVNDMLFAPNGDGNLYVFDLNDGKSQKQPVKTVELGGRLWAQPVTDGQRIFVTSLDHQVYAIDVSTYKVIWPQEANQETTKLDGAIPGSPVLGSDGALYVGSLAAQLEQFNSENGEHMPVFSAKDWIWSTPVANGDSLYFGDVQGNFYSFNTSTGELNWSIKPDGAITASPLVLSDYILIATETGKTDQDPGTIFAISFDSEPLWNEEVGGNIYTTPVIAGDLILVAPLAADGYLYAYDMNGREKSWSPFVPEK